MAEAKISVARVRMDKVKVGLVGVSGLYCHRMAAKAKKTLLIGGRKKTAAERVEIKHDPVSEFRDSMHIDPEWHEQAAVHFPAMAIKSAMCNVALELPGIKKTQVQRLVYLPQERVPIYGIPRLRCDVTRSADIGKTPDIRTRAYFAEWATEVEVHFATPALTKTAILTLLENAGLLIGIGDFRQEKGKGAYGTFRLANSTPDTKAAFQRLVETGKEAQMGAIESPVPDNAEAAEMMALVEAEIDARS